MTSKAGKGKPRKTGNALRRGIDAAFDRVVRRPLRWLRRMILRVILFGGLAMLALILLFTVVNPPITHTMWAEKQRLGSIDRAWVPIEEIAPVLQRSVVVAEDANFCGHWGFDTRAIRAAINAGGARGGSTITQQTVKNVFLWQGRSYVRKALEAMITPIVELTWSKRRILEVYLNIAEFDEGVFGIEAASQRYFGVAPDQISPAQAALLATVLPSPKKRNAARPSAAMKRKARQIRDGAATIRKDGRDDCFETP